MTVSQVLTVFPSRLSTTRYPERWPWRSVPDGRSTTAWLRSASGPDVARFQLDAHRTITLAHYDTFDWRLYRDGVYLFSVAGGRAIGRESPERGSPGRTENAESRVGWVQLCASRDADAATVRSFARIDQPDRPYLLADAAGGSALDIPIGPPYNAGERSSR